MQNGCGMVVDAKMAIHCCACANGRSRCQNQFMFRYDFIDKQFNETVAYFEIPCTDFMDDFMRNLN